MIKVLCISKIAPSSPSGVVTYYQKLCEYFSNDPDVHIDLVTTGDASPIEKKLSGIVRRIIHLFSFGNKRVIKLSFDINLKLTLHLVLRRFRNVRYEIIHAQDVESGSIAKDFFARKIPLILTCHFNDNPVEEDLLRYKFQLKDKSFLTNVYRDRFKEVDKFIFVSNYAFYKTKHLLEESANVEIIYNGADFQKSNQKQKNNGRIELVNVGFVEERKNQKIFITIAKELIQKNFFNFHITIVGDGPDLAQIKDVVGNEGLDSYFSFTGWVFEVDNFLEKADLYIHTAINDNCPYAVIEAISNKLPAIGFRVGGLPEIIDEEFLFHLNDYRSVADFIIKNHLSLCSIGDLQYEKICDSFSVTNQFNRTKEEYLSLLKQPVLVAVEKDRRVVVE